MLQQTPLLTYSLVLLTTLFAPLLAYVIAHFSREELPLIKQYVSIAYWSLTTMLMITIISLTATKLLAGLITATAIIFTLTSRQKERALLPLLALTLYASLQNKTILTFSSVIIFLILMLYTTLYITEFVKNNKLTIKKSKLFYNIAVQHGSYVLVGSILVLLTL